MLFELPETTKELAVGFYNVVVCLHEIDAKCWKIKQRRLRTDIVKAFDVHALDVLCLSGLGQPNESLDDGIVVGTGTWIKNLISAEEGMTDITIYADDHYVTIAKDTRVDVTHYEIVRGLVPGQEERSFQLFRVLVKDTNQQVCIINCEAPGDGHASAAQSGPSTKRRRATDGHASAAQLVSATASSSSAASSDVCSAA